jgi:hypothetical protein
MLNGGDQTSIYAGYHASSAIAVGRANSVKKITCENRLVKYLAERMDSLLPRCWTIEATSTLLPTRNFSIFHRKNRATSRSSAFKENRSRNQRCETTDQGARGWLI